MKTHVTLPIDGGLARLISTLLHNVGFDVTFPQTVCVFWRVRLLAIKYIFSALKGTVPKTAASFFNYLMTNVTSLRGFSFRIVAIYWQKKIISCCIRQIGEVPFCRIFLASYSSSV